METDAALLRRSRSEPDAFVEVCERHASDLSLWLRREVGPDTAEDLLAETLSRAWFARRRFRDPGDGSAGPWLQGIARNLVREYRREGLIETRAMRRLGLPPSNDSSDFAETDDRIAASAEYEHLGPLVAELPADQRAALELRVVGELDYGEIGSRLAVNTVTARTRVHRALRTLRARSRKEQR